MRRASIATLVTAAALGLSGIALAITGGQADGADHPYVGALLADQAFSDGTWAVCSGTLIAPTIFLTAAHCGEDGSTVNVTFSTDYNASTDTTYSGTFRADPAYNHATGHPHDIAVVVLDAPGPEITPAQLPTLGQLDSLPHNSPIVSVGYGAQSVTQEKGGKVFHYKDVRYETTGSFTTVTPVWLKASENPAKGDGGTCYGDSGGPNFIGDSDTIAATTVTGDAFCRATNVDYRLDTTAARDFLAQYVTLP